MSRLQWPKDRHTSACRGRSSIVTSYGRSAAVIAAAALVSVGLTSGGCGYVAFRPPAEASAFDLAWDAPAWFLPAASPAEHVLAARASMAIEEGVPGLEIYLNITQTMVEDKIAGYSNAGEPIKWDMAYEGRLPSVDVQIVVHRPPRPATSLQAGDTFIILRISYDQFAGQQYVTPGGITVLYEDMTLIGGWLDVRTVLNAFGRSRIARPYLQFGGGIVMYPDTPRWDTPASGALNGANWAQSYKLGWHMAVGVEARWRRWGAFIDIGMQTIAPPDMHENALVSLSEAQDLLTFPVRIGLMMMMF